MLGHFEMLVLSVQQFAPAVLFSSSGSKPSQTVLQGGALSFSNVVAIAGKVLQLLH